MLGIGSEAVTEAERAELGNAERQYDAGRVSIPVKNQIFVERASRGNFGSFGIA